MESISSPDRAGPGQTIVIDRRDRSGCFRRVFLPLLLGLSLFLNCSLIATQTADLLPKLEERYVAGDPLPTTPKIAIVEVDGAIMDSTVDFALKQIRQAREDRHVKAVVLRVDSPGGTVSGSDQIWREIDTLKRAKKPVVVSMGGMAASGGYYVSAPADYIFAEPTTLTGSIGVIMEIPQLSGLLEKVGVGFETITTGPWKDSGSMFRPMSAEEKKRWREMIDDSYQRFVRIVAQGRKLKRQDATDLADGSVYTAHEALDKKLVDELGYLDDAIRAAQSRAKLESVRVVKYHKPLSLSDALLSMSAPQNQLRLDRETLLKLQTPQLLFLAR
jgi:protease IV